jgi:hypothetical protein
LPFPLPTGPRDSPVLNPGRYEPLLILSALDDAISLVHIPISAEGEEDEQLSRVYWTIEHAISESEEFFNITSNRIEVCRVVLWFSVHSGSLSTGWSKR